MSIIRSNDANRAPERGAAAALTGGLDRALDFIVLERHLIVRRNTLQAKGGLLGSLSLSLRIYSVVIAHIGLYWAIGKGMPGNISSLSYNVAAFALWMAFADVMHLARPANSLVSANVPLGIRWINLFIADFTWTLIRLLIGLAAIYITFWLFPAPGITGVIESNPDLIGFFLSMLLASILGLGTGLVLQHIRTKWPPVSGFMEVLMWLLFVTSGIYDAFVGMNPVIAQYYVVNPLLTIIEFGRHALDAGYPVDGLSLLYPIGLAGIFLLAGLLLRRKHADFEFDDAGMGLP